MMTIIMTALEESLLSA